MSWRSGGLTVALLVPLLFGWSCKGDEEPEADGTGGGETPPDVLSSATPGLVASALEATHAGWGEAGCPSCHRTVHQQADFTPPACASCHGTNGATPRPLGHQDQGCASCHESAHQELALASANDCIACHRYAETDDLCAATNDAFDVVVVGAGGGGLGAAAELATNGVPAVVLEQHFRVGGYMANFRRGNYRFEVSLHGYTGLDNPESFRALDIWDRIEPVRVDPLYTVHFPDGEYVVPADIDEYEARLKSWFPDEADGIDRLFRQIEDLMAAYAIVARYIDEGRDISDMSVQAEIIQEAAEQGLTDAILRLQSLAMTDVTLGEFLEEFISDPRLVSIWTRLASFIGLEPDRASALYFLVMWNSYHNDGWYYFRGGSQAVSDALASVIEERGGRIRLHSRVTDIVVEDGLATTVRTEDGACFETRYVISNASAPSTLLELVGRDQLPEVDASSPFHPDRLELGHETSMSDSFSALAVYLGVDHDYADALGDAHEVFMVEAVDQNENYDAMREPDLETVEFIACEYTRLDPTMAPEGKTVLGLVTLLGGDWEEGWRLGEGREAYQAFKEEAARVLVERLEQNLLPGLSDHIEVMEVGSPVTLRGFTLNRGGAIYGWAHTPAQSLLGRLPQQTPIDNLILAGAWTFPGAGQSAAISSGRAAAGMVLDKLAAD